MANRIRYTIVTKRLRATCEFCGESFLFKAEYISEDQSVIQLLAGTAEKQMARFEANLENTGQHPCVCPKCGKCHSFIAAGDRGFYLTMYLFLSVIGICFSAIFILVMMSPGDGTDLESVPMPLILFGFTGFLGVTAGFVFCYRLYDSNSDTMSRIRLRTSKPIETRFFWVRDLWIVGLFQLTCILLFALCISGFDILAMCVAELFELPSWAGAALYFCLITSLGFWFHYLFRGKLKQTCPTEVGERDDDSPW